jgi:hypothetical protein
MLAFCTRYDFKQMPKKEILLARVVALNKRAVQVRLD